MKKLNKEQAIKIVGEAAVSVVMNEPCEPTCADSYGTDWFGMMEFSAKIEVGGKLIQAYWYQDEEAAMAAESLDDLEWGEPDYYSIIEME